MSMNKVMLQARLPFDLEIKNGGDEAKAVLQFTASVKRNYKKEGDKYYPEDLITCKAFGKTAIFINTYFKKGSNLIVEGELRRDDDYEKDGNKVKGQMYVNVGQGGAHFVDGAKDSGDSNEKAPAKAATPAPAKPAAGANPFAPRRSPV